MLFGANTGGSPVVLVTGCAGFIGFHVSSRLLAEGINVVGLDDVNSYYDVGLKKSRLGRLAMNNRFVFAHVSIQDRRGIEDVFSAHRPSVVINLAAQAGVRYSLTNPMQYIDSNIAGFVAVLEACCQHSVKHLLYASSSSVYGLNAKIPFSTQDSVAHPVSLYAATKKANELMAHVYSHLYGLPTTGLRFFTVYGPWGRPDMAYFSFTKAILEERPIQVFNHGHMKRDFTYIDDVVEVVVRLIGKAPQARTVWDAVRSDPSTSAAPYRLYNIGNNRPVEIGRFIEVLEQAIGKTAEKEYLPMQPGDVVETCADTDDLAADIGYRPQVTIEEGVPKFVAWYRDYYGVY